MKTPIYRNNRFRWGSGLFFLIFISGLIAPFIAPYSPGMITISQRLLPPSSLHYLGTDLKGMDLWTSLLYGTRISLGISIITVLISTTVGTVLGLCAGYFRGGFEQVLMRSIDVLLSFPGILLPLVLSSLLSHSYQSLIFTLSLTGWVSSARLVRGEILALREREFIQAAKAIGVPPHSILLKHLLPHLFPLLTTQVTLSIPAIIMAESSLSFLGLGPRGTTPTWGQILNEGRTVIGQAPLLTIAPGLSIFLVVLSINLIADSLRDYFDLN